MQKMTKAKKQIVKHYVDKMHEQLSGLVNEKHERNVLDELISIAETSRDTVVDIVER